MQTFTAIDPASATGRTRQLMDEVGRRFGRVPQMLRLLAHSPAATEAYLQFNFALAQAELPAPLRALIVAVVADAGGCDYSRVIAHAQAERAGLPQAALAAALQGEQADPRTVAARGFALAALRSNGHVAPERVDALRAAGFSDAEVVEIVACVALGLFRNYFNLIAGTEIDPPPAAQPAVQ